ncbi:MAG: ABC transporter ATP-binding protein, partial [Clostridia bacterium]|nr:ABC transporter ATP-binding protein [Clostridia bacterium]
MNKKTKEKEKSNSLKNYLFMLRFVAKHTPFYLFGYLFFDMISNLPWILSNVVLLKYIIDVVTSGEQLYRAAVAVGGFAVFVILSNLANTLFYEIYVPKAREKLNFRLYSVIYEKAAKMDFEAYDNPAYYNDLVLAMTSMSERAQMVISNTQDILTNIVSVLTIGTVIVTIDPI